MRGPSACCGGTNGDALEEPQRRLDGRLEEVAEAVGGGYCRLQMPLRPALGVREAAAGHRLGALEGGGGVPRPLPMHPCCTNPPIGPSPTPCPGRSTAGL